MLQNLCASFEPVSPGPSEPRAASPRTSNQLPIASPRRTPFSSYESDLRNSPERATAFGGYRYNDKLADYSLDAIAHRHKTYGCFLSRWKPSRPPAFRTRTSSHTTSFRVLQQRIADFDLKEYEMPINQQNGFHTGLADLPLSVPFDSVKHYEDYMPAFARSPSPQPDHRSCGRDEGQAMPVRFLLEKPPVQCQGIIAPPFCCRQKSILWRSLSKTRSD